MPVKKSDASALAPLLDGNTAGELIPELVRHGLQQLIELEVAAVLGAVPGVNYVGARVASRDLLPI